MSSILCAIGTANPVNQFSQMQILRFMTEAHQLRENDAVRLKKLYENSGIQSRFSVLDDFGNSRGDYTFFGNENGLTPFPTTKKRGLVYQDEAIKVSREAVQNLLDQLPDFDQSTITHLITVSCTGMYAPGLDIDIIEAFGLSKSIERTCINFMGCYGAFNALKSADYICRADSDAKVLIVCTELCTLHFQRESTLENWLSNSLFGDGSAAILIQSEKNSSTGLRLKSFYNELFTEAKDDMSWRIGDTGYEMHLSSHIAKNISSKIHHITEKLLQKAQLKLADVHAMAVHPGGRRIVEVCQEAFENKFCLKNSFDVLSQYGNMSSVTILFVLKNMLAESNPGTNVMSFAFGPGLTFESMLLQTM